MVFLVNLDRYIIINFNGAYTFSNNFYHLSANVVDSNTFAFYYFISTKIGKQLRGCLFIAYAKSCNPIAEGICPTARHLWNMGRYISTVNPAPNASWAESNRESRLRKLRRWLFFVVVGSCS